MPPPETAPHTPSHRIDDLPSTLWRLFAVGLLLMLIWWLRQPMLLLFGAVLLASSIRALADPLARLTRMPPRLAVVLVVVGMGLFLAGGVWLIGEPLAEQLQALRQEIPQAWQVLRNWLSQGPLGSRLLGLIDQANAASLPWQNIANMAAGAAGGLADLVLIVLVGLYLAFDVFLYRNGLVRLFPPARRARMTDAFDAVGHSLTRWVLGQVVTMVIVGLTVAAGLSLLGMPMALALAAIAGVLEFVPFFGPIVSGALAVLLAFGQGPQQALSVALLFLAIQQLEGNLLVPLVQRWAVALPPAMVVASVLVFSTLFGAMGVLIATPALVVVTVLVRRLYVEEMLEAETE